MNIFFQDVTDKATVRVKRILSLGLTLDYTQMRRSMHRIMVGRDVSGTRSKSEIRDNEVSPWYLSSECPAPENISVSVTT